MHEQDYIRSILETTIQGSSAVAQATVPDATAHKMSATPRPQRQAQHSACSANAAQDLHQPADHSDCANRSADDRAKSPAKRPLEDNPDAVDLPKLKRIHTTAPLENTHHQDNDSMQLEDDDGPYHDTTANGKERVCAQQPEGRPPPIIVDAHHPWNNGFFEKLDYYRTGLTFTMKTKLVN